MPKEAVVTKKAKKVPGSFFKRILAVKIEPGPFVAFI
jgi:hypothetical protein